MAIACILSAFLATSVMAQEVRGDAVSMEPWLGVHLMSPGHSGVDLFTRAVRGGLAPMGVNAIILQVDCSFEFQSHPELRASADGLTRQDAQEIAAVCRSLGIRLIPQFNCFGHQSWRGVPGPLLATHPDMSETPGITPEQHMSWCPRHPDLHPIVFDLLDEIADAFDADALHVGMDEVFIIASEHCPRCRGADPAEIFAEEVNALHRHVVGERGLTMLIWGDRLLDAEETGYPEWEASASGTAGAIDVIPTDIVICDWHYSALDVYPSIPIFLSRGFRVWPASWKDGHAAAALVRYAQSHADEEGMVGHLATTWTGSDVLRAVLREDDPAELEEEAVQSAEALRLCMEMLRRP